MAGPVVLILLGVLFLMSSVGVMPLHMIGFWFARFWPVLLIIWGAIKLAEYYAAQRGGYPASGIGVGGVLLLVFIIGLGVTATTASKLNWEAFGSDINWDEDGGMQIWGNTYDFNDTLQQPFPAGATLRVNANHGDVTINAWDSDQIKVVVAKKIGADSQEEANRINSETKPSLSVSGNTVTLDSEPNVRRQRGFFNGPAVRADLDIFVPRKGNVEVSADHGDLKIAGRQGDLQITHNHGDLALDDIDGNVSISSNHGDVAAHKISGNFSLEGPHVGDSEISDIGGSLTLSGTYVGDVDVSRVAKAVRFDSSRTNLQIGALLGEMKMDGSDLRLDDSTGGFSIHTRSKDIHLENVSGDVSVQNSNGEVEIHTGAKPGDVTVTNRNGAIQLYLPQSQAFTLEASTRDGNIQSDFEGINVSNRDSYASASGSVGSNGRRIQLTNEHADIEVRRGMIAPEMPEPPAMPAAPGAGAPSTRGPKHAPATPRAPKTPEPTAAHTGRT